MKNKQNLGDKIPFITIDKSLDKLHDKIMFTKKLEKTNEILLTARLPKNKPPLSVVFHYDLSVGKS